MVEQCIYNNNNTIFLVAISIVLILLVITNNREVEHFGGFFNIKKFLKKLNIGRFIKKIFSKFKGFFTKIGRFVVKIVRKIGKAFKSLIGTGVKAVFGKLRKMVKKTTDKITAKLKPFLTVLGIGLAASAIAIFTGCIFYMGIMRSKTTDSIEATATNMPIDQLQFGQDGSDFKSKLQNTTGGKN